MASKYEGAEELRDEYLREVTHVDWADKLPTRSARWLLITAATTALGFADGPIAGTAAAPALSAVEPASAFIDEKIKQLGDWRGRVLAKVRAITLQKDGFSPLKTRPRKPVSG